MSFYFGEPSRLFVKQNENSVIKPNPINKQEIKYDIDFKPIGNYGYDDEIDKALFTIDKIIAHLHKWNQIVKTMSHADE